MKTTKLFFAFALTAFFSLPILGTGWLLIGLVSLPNQAEAQNIGINTTGATPNSKALLDIDAGATNTGLLIPRLTTAQRNAITAPIPESLLIYNTTTGCFEAYYTPTSTWVAFGCIGCAVPTAVTASAAPNPICEGSTLTLTGGATGATSWNWTGPNSYSSSAQSPTIAGITPASGGIYNLTAGNACGWSAPVSTASVSVSQAPTTAAAGTDINPACGVNTATLAGNTPTVGTGLWTVVSGTATITTPSSPTSGVTGLSVPGTATLRWTISNAPCADSFDEVVITTISCCPSFSDDFLSYSDQASADAVWVTTDITKYRVNITNDNLDFDARSDQTDNRIAYDLGYTVSNTAWILRFKMTVSTHVQGAEPQHLSWSIGIVADNVDAATNTDYIGLAHASNNSVSYYKPISGDALNFDGMGVEPDFTLAPGVYTKWVKIIRTSATTYDVSFYDDANYTVLNETRTGTCAATTTGLRYIMMTSEYANQVVGTADWRGTIDDIQFCDGVTSF